MRSKCICNTPLLQTRLYLTCSTPLIWPSRTTRSPSSINHPHNPSSPRTSTSVQRSLQTSIDPTSPLPHTRHQCPTSAVKPMLSLRLHNRNMCPCRTLFSTSSPQSHLVRTRLLQSHNLHLSLKHLLPSSRSPHYSTIRPNFPIFTLTLAGQLTTAQSAMLYVGMVASYKKSYRSEVHNLFNLPMSFRPPPDLPPGTPFSNLSNSPPKAAPLARLPSLSTKLLIALHVPPIRIPLFPHRARRLLTNPYHLQTTAERTLAPHYAPLQRAEHIVQGCQSRGSVSLNELLLNKLKITSRAAKCPSRTIFPESSRRLRIAASQPSTSHPRKERPKPLLLLLRRAGNEGLPSQVQTLLRRQWQALTLLPARDR